MSDDHALLARGLFCAGIWDTVTFVGAAMLPAPYLLPSRNTGDKFPTDTIGSHAKRAVTAKKLHVEAHRLSDNEIAERFSKLN